MATNIFEVQNSMAASTVLAPSVTAVNNAIQFMPQTKWKSTTYGSTIPTTAQTTTHTLNVPAGSTVNGSQLELILNFAKTGTAGTVTINVYLNSIGAGTQIGTCVYAGGNRNVYFERTFNVQASTLDQADRNNNIVHIEIFPVLLVRAFDDEAVMNPAPFVN